MFELRLENESGNVVDINDGVNYLVTGVSGLNPPTATIFTQKSPNRKGSKYNGSTLNERPIVITIKLLGAIEHNRNTLYDWIDTEQYLKIYYRNSVKNVYCEGYVQDAPFEVFTDNEVISLAVLCPDPYFKDLGEISADISDFLAEFTFPFAIDENGIPMSTYRVDNATTIVNSGAETGIKVRVVCNGAVTGFMLYDANDATRQFEVNTTLADGTVMIIDTDSSPKSCIAYLSNGTTENLMKYVTANPTWFTLKKGINTFAYSATSGERNANVHINFIMKHLGV